MPSILIAGATLLICPIFREQTLLVIQVKGAPFSADEVEIHDAGPNVRIASPIKTVKIYRDSAGRTRVNVSVPRDPTGNPNVVIEDPVANVTYVINEKHKFARRLGGPNNHAPYRRQETTRKVRVSRR